jgi:hypothetical protein
MKQRILIDQLKELTKKQQNNLRAWWKPEVGDKVFITSTNYKGYDLFITTIDNDKMYPGIAGWIFKSECLPLLTLGQMMELIVFLNYDQCKYESSFETVFHPSNKSWDVYGPYIEDEQPIELVDKLWKFIKKVL